MVTLQLQLQAHHGRTTGLCLPSHLKVQLLEVLLLQQLRQRCRTRAIRPVQVVQALALAS